jgi:hypothetical protein
MTQTIGFIGTGMIGSALARLTAQAGIDLVLSNSRGPGSLADLVVQLGPRATATTIEEATKADLIVATVPLGAHTSLPADLLAGKIVIDTMNYYPSRDETIPALDKGELTSSELIQRHLKDSKIVKALFNLDFHHLYTNARPHGSPERTTLPIAGDDTQAKQAVAKFMDRIGYDALDTGSLADSWRIEPGSPIYVWPYVPNILEDLSGEDRIKWYWEHSGVPVTREKAQALVDGAVRPARVGGFPNVLPPEHVELVGRIYKNRKG